MVRVFLVRHLFSSRHTLVFLLLTAMSGTVTAAPQPWGFWLPADAPVSASISHGLWQDFLDQAVVHDDQAKMNLVRYRSLAAADYALLDKYLVYMQGIDPRNYKQSEQMAYWINLYNAVTVQIVLDHPDEESIRDMGARIFSRGPWSDELIRVAGKELTLDDIEHRILRPIWKDRRIHFALNCASIGCPELAATAYTAKELEALLDAGELKYINSSRALMFTADGGLVLSSIFDWYAEDFVPDKHSLPGYLADYLDSERGERLRAYSGPIQYQYDWSLNSSD